MSKQKKLGDIPISLMEMKGCVIAPYRASRTPTITIQKKSDDPGAVYITFWTKGCWCGVLRGCYDKNARNIPKPTKPETAAYQIMVGKDDIICIVGNYNITKDIEGAPDTAHLMIDDIMQIMASNDLIKTLHDADGFMRLTERNGFHMYRHCWRDRDQMDPDDTDDPCDITVECIGIKKSDKAILEIIDSLGMMASRVAVNYNGRHWYPYYEDIEASVARKIVSQDPCKTVLQDMEAKQFDDKIIDGFTSLFTSALMPADTDRKNEQRRISSRRYCFSQF